MDTEICKSLIEWFQTLNLQSQNTHSVEELSDGVALAEALHQFVPETFTDAWLSKIKTDAGSTNWRLKMSNMRKVIEGVYDYYNDVLGYSLLNFPRPDAMRIAEKCDVGELERLLQLVLGCAVNCSAKQDYIRQIMVMEESLQQNIMRALQELESTWQGGSLSRNSISIANFDYKMLQEERDMLAQKLFESEKKLSLLNDEKINLNQELIKVQAELERLQTMPPAIIDDDGVSLGPLQAGSARYNDLRRQLDLIKEDLMQSETAREDLKMKSQQQETEMEHMQQRIDELTKLTSELTQLKDEVDILRETNDKLKVYEAQLEVYKKKMEDYNDLKKQIKMLEERSADYVQQNVQFEEEAKKYTTLKGQVELFKKEIQELHSKLDQEMSKNVKLEFDNKNLETNINALQRAKESLLKERDNLREALDELKCGQLSEESGSNTVSKELQPTAMIEKIQRLEIENKALREGQGGQTALALLLDDANKRNENMREQLKAANERILSLTHLSSSENGHLREVELSKQIKQLMELNEQKTLMLDETLAQFATLQGKVSQLETTLANREQELLTCDLKYRKCVEKAKEVIKNLDPRMDVNLMVEKAPETDEDNKSKMTLLEEQLMTTAFYRLSVNAQRDAIDSKLAALMGQGNTFLARQRQSAPRKSVTSFKAK